VHARTALISLIVAAILFITAAYVSADSSRSSPASVGTGIGVIVPPAWAGVWDIHEEFAPGCSGDSPRSYRETLCAGETVLVFTPPYPTPDVPAYQCSAPVFTDSTLKLTCYRNDACHCCLNGNTLYFNEEWDTKWSLSGDVATTVTSYSYSRSGCNDFTTCIQSMGTRTRVWPESSICPAVPTAPMGESTFQVIGNPSASPTIAFSLVSPAHVDLSVYDVSGRVIRRLFHEVLAQGGHQVRWDGGNDNGTTAQSGIYFVRLSVGEMRQSATLMLVR